VVFAAHASQALAAGPECPAALAPSPVRLEELKERHLAKFAGDQVVLERVMQDIRILAGEEPLPGGEPLVDRYSPENREKVRGFLTSRLEELGLSVARESGLKGAENVVAEIPGTEKPNTVLELSAHFDSVWTGMPGADDNGSGVAAVLETARILRELPPKVTVRIVFTDLEEHGFWGSKAHVQGLKRRGEKIAGAVVVDMIGYHPETNDPSRELDIELGCESMIQDSEALWLTRTLARQFASQHAAYNERGTTLTLVGEKSMPGTADHGAYWRAGFPAILISEDFDHATPAYHKPHDKTDLINKGYLLHSVQTVVEGLTRSAGVELPAPRLPRFLGQLPALESGKSAP
jgi:hypothetical protein